MAPGHPFYGKDILTTHTVYWTTMLHALGLPQPHLIFAHGWWISEGAKMSKSLGNIVKPLDLAGIYGVDAFRYFPMREMTPGRDANFSRSLIDPRYQADLANDLGNLLSRVVSMIERYCQGRVLGPGELTDDELALKAWCEGIVDPVFNAVESLAVNEGVAQVLEAVGEINRYLERTAPWARGKEGKRERVGTILYCAAEALRLCASLLYPVMPEKMEEVVHRLGVSDAVPRCNDLVWGKLQPGRVTVSGEPLFPRDLGAREWDEGSSGRRA